MSSYNLTHLAQLEHEAVFIMREVAAQFERPALLFSGGKDSIVTIECLKQAGEPLVLNFDQPIALPAPFADHPGAATAMAPPVPGDALALLDAAGEVRPLEELEAELIRYAITHYRGQMSEVARRLQIGRSTLYRKLEALGLNTEREEADSEGVATERQPLKIA